MAKRGRGRPSILTKKITDAYCAAISIGAPHDTAASYAGVNYVTALKWRDAGQAERERIDGGGEPDKEAAKYLQFFNAVEEARYERRIKWLQVVDQAASREADWAGVCCRTTTRRTLGRHPNAPNSPGRTAGR